MDVPVCKDLIQGDKPLEVPEIRVWCHPHFVKKSGSDYYKVFDTFKEAMDFCSSHDEAEEVPLLAFRGYEINLFEIAN